MATTKTTKGSDALAEAVIQVLDMMAGDSYLLRMGVRSLLIPYLPPLPDILRRLGEGSDSLATRCLGVHLEVLVDRRYKKRINQVFSCACRDGGVTLVVEKQWNYPYGARARRDPITKEGILKLVPGIQKDAPLEILVQER